MTTCKPCTFFFKGGSENNTKDQRPLPPSEHVTLAARHFGETGAADRRRWSLPEPAGSPENLAGRRYLRRREGERESHCQTAQRTQLPGSLNASLTNAPFVFPHCCFHRWSSPLLWLEHRGTGRTGVTESRWRGPNCFHISN